MRSGSGAAHAESQSMVPIVEQIAASRVRSRLW